jgi:hypothetical protein
MATIPPSGTFRDKVAREVGVEILDILTSFANEVGSFTLGDRADAYIALVDKTEALRDKLTGAQG